MLMKKRLIPALSVALLLSCGGGPVAESPEESATAPPNPDRNAYFGDLHVHTRYSFDAFLFGGTAHPDDAYRFAKGETIEHPTGRSLALDRPLDFQAVTDHGMYLGMMPAMTEADSSVYNLPEAADVRNAETIEERRAVFRGLFAPGTKKPLDMGVVRAAWGILVDAAERHNDPGKFTAFIGYEFTSDGGASNNLHRNVIFRGSEHPPVPFSRLDSMNPEDLWATMDRWRAEGIDSLAIPHNSNGSGGRMFETQSYNGEALDADYAAGRMRNEPLVEATQVKGTSDTHPSLSPNDEWANFEIVPYKVATSILGKPAGSYVRDAYLRGLQLADSARGNPYKFGLIGSSDTHVAAGSFRENDYWSKVGLLDATPDQRGSVPGSGTLVSIGSPTEMTPSSMRTQDGSGRTYRDTYYHHWGASGLAGVWAEENTRSALFDAMRRKETFATSGTRIRVRFFGGAAMADADLDGEEFLANAYRDAAPMGADYPPDDSGAPAFAVWALRDPLAAPLQRVQIIKGMTRDGKPQEIVYDVACAGGAPLDPNSHRCPDNNAGVDLSTCEPHSESGAAELKTVWHDPDFDPQERAFYYVRVLENPTCRWSTWDALRAGVEPRRDLPTTIQERAWSSPIWYNPR